MTEGEMVGWHYQLHGDEFEKLQELVIDSEAWHAAAHRVTKSQTRLSDFTFTFSPWKESYDQPRQQIKKQRHYFVNKGLSSQGYGFSNSHVWM